MLASVDVGIRVSVISQQGRHHLSHGVGGVCDNSHGPFTGLSRDCQQISLVLCDQQPFPSRQINGLLRMTRGWGRERERESRRADSDIMNDTTITEECGTWLL